MHDIEVPSSGHLVLFIPPACRVIGQRCLLQTGALQACYARISFDRPLQEPALARIEHSSHGEGGILEETRERSAKILTSFSS